jgi:hypothetical protein
MDFQPNIHMHAPGHLVGAEVRSGCGDGLHAMSRCPHLSVAEKLFEGHSDVPNDLSQQDW